MKTSTEQRIEVIRDTDRLERKIFAAALQFRNLMRQRKGQALMNALRCEAPELYDILTDTNADCFYDDTRYPLTLSELGFDQFQHVLDDDPEPLPIRDGNREWCAFCGWIPKGGMHVWNQHTMTNYKPTPVN